MGAQFLAQAGDGLVQAALGKFIVFGGQRGFDLEGARSPDDLLRIALYVFVPYTILSPFLGVIIDRWDRRRLLVLANGFRAAVLLLVGLVSIDVVGDLALFLTFLLTLVSTRVVLATKAAALPSTLAGGSTDVPRRGLLVEANAVSQLGGALFQLGGAGVALIAAGLIPVEPIVILGALVYLLGAGCAWMIGRAGEVRAHHALSEEIARVARTIAAGVREVARIPKAGASITAYFWLRLLWSFSLVGIGFVARDLLAGDNLTVAVITGGAGAGGALLGFIMANRLHQRVHTTAHLVMGSSVVAGASVTLFGAGLQLQSLVAQTSLALLAFFLGVGFFLAKISLDSMVQEALGDDFRGRAFSIYDIAYNLAWVVAAALMKLFWSESVQGVLIAAMGVVFLAGMTAIGAWFRTAGLLSATSVEAQPIRR
jgi:hypothetical protein